MLRRHVAHPANAYSKTGERAIMKRALAVAVVLLAGGLAAAAAASACGLGTLAVDDSSSLVAPGTVVLDASGLARDNDYTVWEFQGSGCDGDTIGSQDGTTPVEGNSFSVTFSGLAAGTYSYVVGYDGEGEGDATNCVDVTIGSHGAAPELTNAFLCYSADQGNPGVWPMAVAKDLLKSGGYWSPYAVQGNVDGGTNVGGYHLTCNLASSQSAGDSTLGGAGEVDGASTKPDVTDVAGYYPIAG
jgi:hypothetical protein